MSNEKTYLVAVYGSLKQHFGNHRCLEGAEYLGHLWSEEKFTMYSLGGFLVFTANGNTSIFFEIYKVNEDVLKRVYRLEGYNGNRNHPSNTFYDTMDIDTPWGKAEIFYFKREPKNCTIVESGNWEEEWRKAAW